MAWIFNLSFIYITYSSQHFELIQYVSGLSRFLFTYQVNDPKVIIDLDDFPSLLKSVVQQPCIQLWQLTTHFYWNGKFDFELMNMLKNNWDSPLEYVVSLFNTSCNTNIIKNNFKLYSILTKRIEKQQKKIYQ